MLDLRTIRENPALIVEKLGVKNFDAEEIIDQILQLDVEIRALKKSLDDNLQTQNIGAREIGKLFKNGRQAEAEALKAKIADLKTEESQKAKHLSEKENLIQNQLLLLPNMPHASVACGKGVDDNEIIYTEGDASDLLFEVAPHWDLVKKYDIIDFDLGSKITGAGFPVYKNKGAKLQRALISFFLDSAIEAGYIEIQPPYLVNAESAYATGQLPDKEGQMYCCTEDNLYLVPTAEVPVTNIYRDIILRESDFPIKNCAYSACFRREAGSYGKDVRGLNRLHQFDKVEIVQIAHPDHSYDILEEMRAYASSLLSKLGLPFRVLRLCGGDISFTSALTYDLEVYAKAQQKWLEVSSVSNFESFQANRLKVRFKDDKGKTRLAHTLNGSALALPRIMAAILENYQTEQGIIMPEVLRKYTGFDLID
ncbi:MAG: serine--tRNA ligase [Bacteroidales bacterium]|jgi:seryl-tRNA synthetase|nr:serine--tRNA ligase [Bacteroidales bacterium]